MIDSFFNDVKTELAKARKKFPTNKLLLGACAEEHGEMIKSLLDFEQKDGTKEQIYKEAVQAVAMTVRLLQEGSEELMYQGVSRDKV